MATPNRSELVWLCRQRGLPAHKGLGEDELLALAQGQRTDPSQYWAGTAHRMRLQWLVKHRKELTVSGCSGQCEVCTDAETLECLQVSGAVVALEKIDMTKEELKEKSPAALRSLAVTMGIAREVTLAMSQEEIIDTLLEVEAQGGGAAAPEEGKKNGKATPATAAPATPGAAKAALKSKLKAPAAGPAATEGKAPPAASETPAAGTPAGTAPLNDVEKNLIVALRAVVGGGSGGGSAALVETLQAALTELQKKVEEKFKVHTKELKILTGKLEDVEAVLGYACKGEDDTDPPTMETLLKRFGK